MILFYFFNYIVQLIHLQCAPQILSLWASYLFEWLIWLNATLFDSQCTPRVSKVSVLEHLSLWLLLVHCFHFSKDFEVGVRMLQAMDYLVWINLLLSWTRVRIRVHKSHQTLRTINRASFPKYGIFLKKIVQLTWTKKRLVVMILRDTIQAALFWIYCFFICLQWWA